MRAIKNFLTSIRGRPIGIAISIAMALVLGAMVILTIYFTLYDLQWLAFLGGILFAAMLAMASQASRAEWMILRRTKQLERIRQQLQQMSARNKITNEALQATVSRAHFLNDLLITPILFISRDLHIHYHNEAACKLFKLPDSRIKGQLLSDIAAAEFPLMFPHFQTSLSGLEAEYQLPWARPNESPMSFMIKQVPYPPGDPNPPGFYLIIRPAAFTAHATRNGSSAASQQEAFAHNFTSDTGESLHLHTISDQLMGWGDPRAKLANALSQDEFLLFAQSIVPLQDKDEGRIFYEVLLRLREEEDNLLPPGGFIPVAERYGMTEDIDRWVVRNLIAWCLNFKRTHPIWDIPRFCINLSAAAIRNPEFAKFVRAELQNSGFPASALCFEIGELETINNHADVAHFIAALKPVGCHFNIDAFGSIKLSFTHLAGLAVDFIKIDGVIVQNLFKTPADMKKLESIVGICRKIGIRTIAEFVEDDETLNKLRELDVDYAQGFGISKPCPIEKLDL